MPAAQAARGRGGAGGGQQRVCYRCVGVFREIGGFSVFRNFIFQVRPHWAFAELLPQRPGEGLGDDYEEKFWRMNEAMNY